MGGGGGPGPTMTVTGPYASNRDHGIGRQVGKTNTVLQGLSIPYIFILVT